MTIHGLKSSVPLRACRPQVGRGSEPAYPHGSVHGPGARPTRGPAQRGQQQLAVGPVREKQPRLQFFFLESILIISETLICYSS
jgi:hypothetical protein